MSLISLASRTLFCSLGQAKRRLQLKERLGRSTVSSERIVAVESTDKLTDPQIVAKVKEHYGIAR